MHDLLLRGGSVVDGAGNPRFSADVAIAAGRIAAVGRISDRAARRTIAVDGLVVAPGFIDMHAHSDIQLLANPGHEAKVAQGVTTEVLGQDGLSYAPSTDTVMDQLRVQLRGWNGNDEQVGWDWRTVGEYLDRLDEGIAVNAAYLVPQGTVRMCVMGHDARPASEDELRRMQGLVAEGLEQGAVGMSAGLTYTPGMYADDAELTALCTVVARYGGYYCPHHRNYGSAALEAYASCLRIAEAAGCALHLAHAHMSFPANRGRASELLALIDAARRNGLDVTLDTYPYLAGATYLHALLPSWIHEGGPAAAVERLADGELRERVRAELEDTGSDGNQGVPVNWDAVVLSGVGRPEHERYVGESIAALAVAAEQRPVDFYCDLLVADNLGTSCLVHIGNEENVREIMRHVAHTAGSDAILVGTRPHPRGWGTFPRYLGRYVRELGVLGLENCIRKMTSLPAQRLGFLDRGLVRPGMAADLVVFDPDTVIDVATYTDPRRLPEGIPFVFVGGEPVIDAGERTGALPGRALRRRP